MASISPFAYLSPDDVLEAAEAVAGIHLTGAMAHYPSYVNRVYAVDDVDGGRWIAKFYRPGRWTEAAIREEHRFVGQCADAGLPVVAPVSDADGETLSALVIEGADGTELAIHYAVYPFLPERGWEPTADEDWLALGSLVAGLHEIGAREPAPNRSAIGPGGSVATAVRELTAKKVVHPEFAAEFDELCASTLEFARPLFEGRPTLRLHGDLHRGNILAGEDGRPRIIDFDDMATGPAVQDLWLFLPGRLDDSRREFSLLSEGYRELRPLEPSQGDLIEALRFMRMVSYLAWQARQRDDDQFLRVFPDWGSRAFWIKELEDLRDQARVVADGRP